MKFSFAGLLALSLTQVALASDVHYAIVVDAGSSGSRLHLMQYSTPSASIPIIKDIFSESIKPGLSSYASQPDNAGASLKPLFDDAMTTLKKNNIDPKTVPVKVLATAGMRLLPESTQQAIYTNVKTYLTKSYPLPIQKVETISGKMEGLYGWLDVNYLSGNFATGSTVGSIDMGGASTQIAFATQDNSHINDEIAFKIGTKRYTVFSKSFLGLGEDQALATISKMPSMDTCYPIQYPLQGGDAGNFNYISCGALYTDLIQANHVAQEILSLEKLQFIAYSGAYYSYHFFGVDQTPDQAVVEKKVQNVCAESWDELKHDYPSTPEKYLSTYCANITYIEDLFYNTYQLQGSQLKIVTQINQIDIDWPLGALLYSLFTNDYQE
jgi:hypothetical protein